MPGHDFAGRERRLGSSMPGHNFAGPERRLKPSAATAGKKRRLQWYLNRLSCMTPAEITYRVVRMLSTHAQSAELFALETVPRPDLALTPCSWVDATAKVDAARYLCAADRIAEGKLDVFALRDIDLGSPPRWNRDPKTGVEAPLSFGKLLDYRDPKLVGDIKYLWELNRHLHLVTLAQAYALSGDAKYFRVIREHLESWFAECPYGMGPNWSSALEAAIRLINWSATWQLLGAAHSPLFEDVAGSRLQQRWLESVYRHAQFVQGYFSLPPRPGLIGRGQSPGGARRRRFWRKRHCCRTQPTASTGNRRCRTSNSCLICCCSVCSPARRTGGGFRSLTNRASKPCWNISLRSWTSAAMFR
jgi:Heparinase II/III N-terminus